MVPAVENLDYSTGKIMYDKPTTYPGTTIDVKNADLQIHGSNHHENCFDSFKKYHCNSNL